MIKKIHSHLKFSPHHHTGRRTSHHHTSYPVLVMIVVVTLLALRLISSQQQGVLATVTESGTINVSAIVPGPPPTTPAVILSPVDGTSTTEQMMMVSGTCEPDLLVKVFKNTILAGSTVCDSSGEFSLSIALLPGRNDLTALNYDSLNQPGPVSPTVVVYLVEPDSNSGTGGGTSSSPIISHPVPSPATAFYISTDYELRGLKKDYPFSWSLIITGGTAPYGIEVDWGDGSKEILNQNQAGLLELGHTYSRSGDHTIRITARDATGRTTYIELVAIVDGPKEAISVPATTTTTELPSYWMASTILVYGLLLMTLVWFWIFEHRHPRGRRHA